MTLARTKRQDDLDSDPFVPADVTTPDGAQTVLDQVPTRLGTLDILVQVVGGSLSPAGGFEALSDEHWKGGLTRPAGRRPTGPGAAPGDDRGQGRRRRPHLLYPAAHAAVRGNPRLDQHLWQPGRSRSGVQRSARVEGCRPDS